VSVRNLLLGPDGLVLNGFILQSIFGVITLRQKEDMRLGRVWVGVLLVVWGGVGGTRAQCPFPPNATGHVVFPDTIVTISQGACEFPCTSTAVLHVIAVIPRSVTSIARFAFIGCRNLRTVSIPDTVTAIGQGAFQATGLTTVVLPDSVTEVPDSGFSACDQLVSLVLPLSITRVSLWAFRGTTSLTSITIPPAVATVANEALPSCLGFGLRFTNVTANTPRGVVLCLACAGNSQIIIPDTVQSLQGYAFHGCSDLTALTIPNSITTIGRFVIARCRLSSHGSLPRVECH
jgi:hypothetical protein